MLMLKSWQDRYLVIVSVTFESKWQIFYGGDLGSFLEVTDSGDSVVTGSVVIAVVIRVSTVVVSVVVSVVNLGFSLSLGLPLEQPVDVIVGGGVGSGGGGGVSGGGHGGGVGHGSVVVGASIGVSTVDGGVVVVENLSVSLRFGLGLSLPLVDG